MSATTTTSPATPPAPADSKVTELQMKGAIAVSVFVCVLFLASLVVAYFAGNTTNPLLFTLIGGINTLISTVVAYWVGSSAGSQRKDAALVAAAAGPSPTPGTVT